MTNRRQRCPILASMMCHWSSRSPAPSSSGSEVTFHHWQSAVPPSLSEATHGPWHEMSNGHSDAATFPPKRQMTAEKIIMRAIVVTDQAAGTAGEAVVGAAQPPAPAKDLVPHGD